MRAAIASLPIRERKVISLYYYGEATMKEIGSEIGVNESRVSQLHARAIKRLRDALGTMGPQQVSELRRALVEFAAKRPVMAKAALPETAAAASPAPAAAAAKAIVLTYRPGAKRMASVRTPVKIDRRRTAVAAFAR